VAPDNTVGVKVVIGALNNVRYGRAAEHIT
jgi:hypothetical protein